MPKPYPPLQTLRKHPNNAARSYAEAKDSGNPFDGGHYDDASAVTQDVIFEMIKKAAKTHQALRFTLDVEHGSEAFHGVWKRIGQVLKVIAPRLDLSVFYIGSDFIIHLYDRTQERIAPSVMDEARDGDFQGQFGHLLQTPPTKH